jgi:hypothetical protein
MSASINHAMWTHGTSVQVELMQNVRSLQRRGWATIIRADRSSNWFHFAIPTPVIVSDTRLRIQSVILIFNTRSPRTFVEQVHVYDGRNSITQYRGLRLSGDHPLERFDVSGKPEVQFGIGVSVGVVFDYDFDTPDSGTIEFSSAGADFL